jgi:hypothetical protein
MAKQELRFTAKIEGKEAVVAAIAPPVDVPQFFGLGRACRYGGRSTDIHSVRR